MSVGGHAQPASIWADTRDWVELLSCGDQQWQVHCVRNVSKRTSHGSSGYYVTAHTEAFFWHPPISAIAAASLPLVQSEMADDEVLATKAQRFSM
jgi:hypothetical protein